MSNEKKSRRSFLASTAVLTALGSSTSKLFSQEDVPSINENAIQHAEKLANIRFTKAEREQISKTILQQQSILESRLRLGEIPNSLAPATTFDPRIAGKDEILCTLSGSLNSNLPSPGPCPENDEELAFAPVWKLCQWLKDRDVKSEKLTRLAIQRLKKFNPKLSCVISYTEKKAIEQARKADAELDQGYWRGLLHGIPWGAKDIIDTEGDKTTWGAEPYKDRVSLDNAHVVDKLEQSGAVLVAKLAVGALAYGDIWYGGTCKNPFDLDEGSSGSSAGSASATAAGLVPFTLGTETYGSIISPCMVCGTTGLRPTYGRVGRSGVMALCWSLDKIGPICRSVLDTAIVLDAINGKDLQDTCSIEAPFYFDPTQNAKGIRLGYDPSLFEGPEKESHYKVLEAARKSGAVLVESKMPEIDSSILLIPLFVEAAAAFEELTRSNKDDLLTWQDDDAWPNTFRQSWLIPAVEHMQANRIRRDVMEKMNKWMNNEFDAFLSPAFSDLLLITNNTGHPALVMRTGMQNQKPTGTTLIGRLYDEGTICRLGIAIESELDVTKIRPKLI